MAITADFRAKLWLFLIVFLISGLVAILYFSGPAISGAITGLLGETFTENLNIHASSSGNEDIAFSHLAENQYLGALKLSGKIKLKQESDEVKVYLHANGQKYLILDSDTVKDLGANAITGFAVKEEGSGDASGGQPASESKSESKSEAKSESKGESNGNSEPSESKSESKSESSSSDSNSGASSSPSDSTSNSGGNFDSNSNSNSNAPASETTPAPSPEPAPEPATTAEPSIEEPAPVEIQEVPIPQESAPLVEEPPETPAVAEEVPTTEEQSLEEPAETLEELPEEEPALQEETPAEITGAAAVKSNQPEEKLTNEDKEKNFQFNEICEETCSLDEQILDSSVDYELIFEITGNAEVKIEEMAYTVLDKPLPPEPEQNATIPETPETNETEEPKLPVNETETPGQNQTANETITPTPTATAGTSATASGGSSGGASQTEQSAGLASGTITPSEGSQTLGGSSSSNSQEESGTAEQSTFARQQITPPITANAIQIPPPSQEAMPFITLIVSAVFGLYCAKNIISDRLRKAIKPRNRKKKLHNHTLLKLFLKKIKFNKKLRFK